MTRRAPALIAAAGVLALSSIAHAQSRAVSPNVSLRTEPLATQSVATGSNVQRWPPPGVFRIDDPGVVPPRPRRRVAPSYTTAAMQAKIEGSVRLQVVVKADGTVGDTLVDRSLDRIYGLDDEAVKAARQWEFTCGSHGGVQ